MPAAQFSALVAVTGGLFAIMAALAGYIIRITGRWTTVENKIIELVEDVQQLIVRKDAEHELIRKDLELRQQRADREHSIMGERLTYLERRELAERRKAEM
jgi:hypothetical protein